MPYIKPEIIDKVRESSNMLEVIGHYVDLKKVGANYTGLSPFVSEKTPSFSISPSKGLWKDFSSGESGIDSIGFLMKKESLSYPEAIKWLAKKYAIPLEYEDSQYAQQYFEKEQKRDKLRPLLESVIRKYEEEFQKLSEDHPAKLEVFQKRKYTSEIIEKYRIGYAPGRSFISDLCKENGRKEDAIEIGIINENNDKFYDRLIFPLIEKKGKDIIPVGLAGRKLNGDRKYPKWLNSPESELYKKDSFLYGLDKAKEEINRKGEVWIVEGYNDVIAWQSNGIVNTVGASGTSISLKQLNILKKLCKRVVFCFDPDKAGKKALLKYIPEFIIQNFRVEVVFLKGELDPDDYARFHLEGNFDYSIAEFGNDNNFREDGFDFLVKESFKGKDELDKANETEKIARFVAKVEGTAQLVFAKHLAKESGVGLVEIKKLLKVKEEEIKATLTPDQDEYYTLPPSVKESLEKLKPEIQKYQMFVANNQVWIQEKGKPPYSFRSVSNFSINIINHMHDEKFPMKLVRIKNICGLERIFDMKSSNMNSPMTFVNEVTAQGNFDWRGSKHDHDLLKTYLFDKMGTGRKIDVLGWQPEGFWIWNNKISDPDGSTPYFDENGVFEKDGVSYYVPSANSIYRSNMYRYEAQKKVKYLPASVSFQIYTSQVLKVHRNHGMVGILFSIASIFQDIVVSETNSFPLLFLFGPASSGKDQLADVCQSFFGQPQTGINLEGGVSTIKAHVREFAQFSNQISQLSEYKNGDSQLDGVLKGLWDRRGYKRGNLDSAVSTDSIPILSSVIMTGNYAPDQEALITRLIWEFMDQTVFTDEETKEFEKLNDMTKKGISSFTDEFLSHRDFVKENFKNSFRGFKQILKERKPEANSRMISNLSVLGAFFKMFNNTFQFPFSQLEMMTHFETKIDKQMNKLDSANINVRWWQCFLASMRGSIADQIIIGRDFKISGNELYFNFTSCYTRIQRQWRTQYGDNAPSQGVMQDSLKKDGSWIDDIKATRMAKGKKSRSTSAYIVNINKIPNRDEIQFAIDFQTNDSSLYANPENNVIERNKKDLPF